MKERWKVQQLTSSFNLSVGTLGGILVAYIKKGIIRLVDQWYDMISFKNPVFVLVK